MNALKVLTDIAEHSEALRAKSDSEIAAMIRDLGDSFLFQEIAFYVENGITLNRLARWAGQMATELNDNDHVMLMLEAMERLADDKL